MIEDSLKSTRNLYRLIVLVSLVSVVFTQSVKIPDELSVKSQLIEETYQLNLELYNDSTDTRVSKNAGLDELDSLRIKLNKKDFTNDNVDFLINKLKDYTFLNRYRIYLENEIKNTKLSDLEEIIERYPGFDIDSNIVIIKPDYQDFYEKIVRFLESGMGLEFRNNEVHYPRDTSAMEKPSIYLKSIDDFTSEFKFYLKPLIGSDSVTEIKMVLTSDTIHLQNTSFTHWVNKKINHDILNIEEESISWLNNLESFNELEKEKTIEELMDDYQNQLSNYKPENQEVNVLGVAIPGILFFYASPILILILIYLMNSNLKHLNGLNDKQKEEFGLFAWSAITKNKIAFIETLVVIIVFPCISNVLLLHTLFTVTEVNIFLISIIVFIWGISVLLSIQSIKEINKLRRRNKFNLNNASQ